MKIQSKTIETSLINSLILLNAWMLIALSSATVSAGESYTGKIVINGVVYGDGESNVTKGSGELGQEKRKIDNFHLIHVKSGIDVTYRQANTVSVQITCDQSLLPIIKTQVNQGQLVIDSLKSFQTRLPVMVEISSPQLSEVFLEGSGDINLQELSGKYLKLILNGSGNADAEGVVEQFIVKSSGSGDVNAKNLVTRHAELNVSGSGNIDLTVKESLRASILGSGSISYFGSPAKVEPHITGSGTVESGD